MVEFEFFLCAGLGGISSDFEWILTQIASLSVHQWVLRWFIVLKFVLLVRCAPERRILTRFHQIISQWQLYPLMIRHNLSWLVKLAHLVVGTWRHWMLISRCVGLLDHLVRIRALFDLISHVLGFGLTFTDDSGVIQCVTFAVVKACLRYAVTPRFVRCRALASLFSWEWSSITCSPLLLWSDHFSLYR